MASAFRSIGVKIAGWTAFIFAILIALDSLFYMRMHNTTGSSVALGFCGAFLSFAAAAFGIHSYEKRGQVIIKKEDAP